MKIEIPVVVDEEMLKAHLDKRIAEIKQGGDFVIVTRCKDCKYHKDVFCFNEHWLSDDDTPIVQPDDFCSYAKPKEIEV